MKISQLKALLAIVRTGSFSAAAADLGCTQSNISHTVNEAEKAWGIRLFVRTRQGCKPTPDGVEALRRVTSIVDIFEELTDKKKCHYRLRSSWCSDGNW